MGKFVLFLSLLSLLVLEAGSLLIPSDPIMWLAATSADYVAARGLLMIFIVILLVTNPPRKLVLRLAVGFTAVITLAVVLMLTDASKMNFLDTLSLSAVAISMGTVALEINHYSAEVDVEALRRARANGGFSFKPQIGVSV